MNPIAKWCKFDKYLDWCYDYRIPKANEFVEGFQYEIISLYYTEFKPKEKHEVYWTKCTVGKSKLLGVKNDVPISHVNAYLNAGYIRVPKDSTLVYVKVNEKNSTSIKEGTYIWSYWMYLMDCKKYDIEYTRILNQKELSMQLFYFELKRRNVLRNESGKITQLKDVTDSKYKYIVANGNNARHAYQKIQSLYTVKDKGLAENQNLMSLDTTDELVFISTGGCILTKEGLNKIKTDFNQIFVIPDSMSIYSELWKKDGEKLKNGFKDKWANKIKPNLKAFINIFNRKKKIKHVTMIDTKSKYPSRHEPVTNRWKPVIKPVLHQPEKSPNRLVCIATKDRKKVRRITWKWANYLVTKAPDKYEYVSKEVYRFLTKIKPGNSFTAALTDYDKNGVGHYKPSTSVTPNKSSSKKAKCKRKKSSPGKQQGVSLKKYYNDYEVSFFRKMDDKSGTAEFIYTVSAKTSEQAIYKAGKKAESEGAELAYFKPVVKRLTNNRKIVEKKDDRAYVRVILPKILDLPIRKDKKGNVVPWTVKSYRLATAEEKAKGSPAFIQTTEEVKTYTKYEITYHKNPNPFKKDKEKKWKHPIKDGRKNKKK